MQGPSVSNANAEGEMERLGVSCAFVAVVAGVVAIFVSVIVAGIWVGTHHSFRARTHHARVTKRDHTGDSSANRACGPGEVRESDGGCVPHFPAPLAFVGPIMDARYTACDVSFASMMCGGWQGDPTMRAMGYANSRYHSTVAKELARSNHAFYRACLTRGSQAAKRETAIEFRHVVDTLLGDLRVAADLPAAWGRVNRAGYADSAGAPFSLRKRGGAWYLGVPGALLDWVHGMSEGRIYQLLQSGPVPYNVVEMQQRIQYIVQVAQTLQHHRSTTALAPVAVPFSDLPQSWPWTLYLAGAAAPDASDLVICDDLEYATWALSSASREVEVFAWRAWIEFHLAQEHAGHLPISGPLEAANLTLALVPESVHAMLIATLDQRQWQKVQAETLGIAQQLVDLTTTRVNIVPDRDCAVQASFSPDRYDHNVNLVRAWRFAVEQQQHDDFQYETLSVSWKLVQPPLFNLGYNAASKWAIFGGALARTMPQHVSFARLVRAAWADPGIATTAERQHFFMVWAQAFCDQAAALDDTLRSTPEFSQVMGCYSGQGMYAPAINASA